FLKSLKVPIIVSIAGTKAGEYACLAKILSNYKWVAGLELNISCPNVRYKDKRQFAQDPKLTSQVVSQVRKVISKTIITKLSPNVSNIVPIARAAAKAGSDVISVINTLIGMSINIHNYRPLLGNVIGGLSGPAIRPVALRMTYEAARSVKIPVIGMGGITNADDALQFLICGARAVEVGTANFINPRVMLEISRGMEHYLKDKKLIDIKQIIGKLKI
ncbi:MAG: dihydroorotate dehydrogenase, partial [Candidatus Omnitrophica bacterium]|nr:dihydroorotate dehydrogenase [Candidatus Omnitrophota bacterium]